MSRTYNPLCPVPAALAWIICIGSNHTTPLSYFQSGAPLTQSSFVTNLKELSAIGIEPQPDLPVTASEVEQLLQQQKKQIYQIQLQRVHLTTHHATN